MKIITDKITLVELREMSKRMFGSLIKAVVDVEKEIMAIDGELHADEEALLVESGSKRESVWGINIYPDIQGEKWIEFDSMINLKPGLGNRTRGVESQKLREKIIKIINKLVKR